MVVGDEGHTLNGHERRVLGLFFRFCPCMRSYVANYSPFSHAAFRASSNGGITTFLLRVIPLNLSGLIFMSQMSLQPWIL